MTIKEAVEFYNQQKEEIHILKQTKENAMSNIVFDKGPLGDIYISKKDALIMLDVLDKYIAILEECLNKEFDDDHIIRCKECKYWNQNMGEYCEKRNSFPGGNWFCADGKRKED